MNEPAAEQAQKFKVVLADDHAVVREGLKMILEAQDDLEVVAEASDVASAVRYARGHHPDVMLLDINMGGESSLPLIPSILEASSGTRILVLTMQEDPAFAREALQAGASGYVLKESAAADMVEAIRQVLAGRTYLHPQVGARLAAEPQATGLPDDLSEREVEVLRMIALGHTNAEIAQTLFLSIRTVESHRAHIQQKLRMSTRAELVRYALEHHLIDT